MAEQDALLPLVAHPDAVILPLALMSVNLPEEGLIGPLEASAGAEALIALTPRPLKGRSPVLGSIATVLQWARLPDGRLRMVVQGVARAWLTASASGQARAREIRTEIAPARALAAEAVVRSVREGLDALRAAGRSFPLEAFEAVHAQRDPGAVADLAAMLLRPGREELLAVLDAHDPMDRLDRVFRLLNREREVQEVQEQISSQAQGEMDRAQKEYVLRQQLKAIQEELGDASEVQEELRRYKLKLNKLHLPKPVLEEIQSHLTRLERLHQDSPESASLRSYLDVMTDLPWGKYAKSKVDVDRAEEILNADHAGLVKVKERILEVLAVMKLKEDARGPVLCLTGPPGVGKTSLAQSIARALQRPFVRISLGGVRDEAEIRGHRRTYIGAMPGRIAQGILQAGVMNPVVLLDELDKLGTEGVGDPTAALLEVLDQEQNTGFRDHYLAVPLDLSKVFFICTANHADWIPAALYDRLEVIELTGYTEVEKIAIAHRHLIPRQLEQAGLKENMIRIEDPVLSAIIQEYTRESGVRQLERRIAALLRKVARSRARGRKGPMPLTAPRVRVMLGPPPVVRETMLEDDRIGVVTGLAWTEGGGELLFIEVLDMPGDGQLNLTGQAGNVMRESSMAAQSYIKGMAKELGISPKRLAETDLHIHLPEGAVPKDGPSAGVGMALGMISVLANRKVRHDVALTGEITLRGDVLSIGGLQEKCLAALRAGIREVVLPWGNRKDLPDLPQEVRKGLRLTAVKSLLEAAERVLQPAEAERPQARKRSPRKPAKRMKAAS